MSLRSDLKLLKFDSLRISLGNLFHMAGAAIEKERSPSVFFSNISVEMFRF